MIIIDDFMINLNEAANYRKQKALRHVAIKKYEEEEIKRQLIRINSMIILFELMHHPVGAWLCEEYY